MNAAALIAILLAACRLAARQPDPTSDRDLRVILDALAGRWEGELEYRDPKTGFTGRNSIDAFIEVTDSALAGVRTITYTDTTHTSQARDAFAINPESQTVHLMPINTTSDPQRLDITSIRVNSPSDWTLVTEREGTIEGNPATIRVTQTLRDIRYTAKQEYDLAEPEGEQNQRWETSTEFRLTRIEHDATQLIGTWKVDLRPRPNEAPIIMDLIISGVEGRKLSGSYFNGLPFHAGRVNPDWDGVRFVFETRDSTDVYTSMGVLKGETLVGATYSPGRNFFVFWRGTKPD